ncbi:DUF3304 domain-containing protein [Pseudomonas fluorescens]|uniref:DUF3304 domain-containing protein n=1 Tax=Pseudomonas fluorescens TaxID=294 RepID=UPI00259B068B|nr:DUF3304 domain-containing protein [Pseudomonas fluorescens]WJK07152.1 DUF3304 domain-containing protein [Pseudomonas fluorescens]
MTVAMNMKRQKIWRRRNLVIGVLVLLLPFLGSYLYNQLRTPGAMLTSENYMDRPIFSFWVDDFWGGNLAAMGSGGITCCQALKGPTVKISWILSITEEQSEQGLKQEDHERILPLPEQKRGDRYLHVRFLPGNTVEIKWSPNLDDPFDTDPESGSITEQGRQQ